MAYNRFRKNINFKNLLMDIPAIDKAIFLIDQKRTLIRRLLWLFKLMPIMI